MNYDCVILAAGLSSRMGKNKLALEIEGKTVIERCIGAFLDTCARIIVVTGAYHDEIRRCLAHYPKVHIAYNKDYREGMFSSVKEGIRHVEAERFFLTPGDYPFVSVDTVRHMANVAGCLVAPVYEGEAGHPVLLDRMFIPAILASTDISLRDCLHDVRAKRQEILVNDIGIITDIDTMEDYLRAPSIPIP